MRKTIISKVILFFPILPCQEERVQSLDRISREAALQRIMARGNLTNPPGQIILIGPLLTSSAVWGHEFMSDLPSSDGLLSRLAFHPAARRCPQGRLRLLSCECADEGAYRDHAGHQSEESEHKHSGHEPEHGGGLVPIPCKQSPECPSEFRLDSPLRSGGYSRPIWGGGTRAPLASPARSEPGAGQPWRVNRAAPTKSK